MEDFDHCASKAAIHMVSAWATTNHISLGQVTVDAKSNEITAIPKLLEIIEISGSLVTIDAMGCQVEIAQKIVDADADYVLAVKGNQPTLHQGIIDFFDDHVDDDFARVNVTAKQLRSYLDGSGGPTTTVWFCKHQALRSFYRYAMDRNYVEQSPLPKILPKRPERMSPSVVVEQRKYGLFSIQRDFTEFPTAHLEKDSGA